MGNWPNENSEKDWYRSRTWKDSDPADDVYVDLGLTNGRGLTNILNRFVKPALETATKGILKDVLNTVVPFLGSVIGKEIISKVENRVDLSGKELEKIINAKIENSDVYQTLFISQIYDGFQEASLQSFESRVLRAKPHHGTLFLRRLMQSVYDLRGNLYANKWHGEGHSEIRLYQYLNMIDAILLKGRYIRYYYYGLDSERELTFKVFAEKDFPLAMSLITKYYSPAQQTEWQKIGKFLSEIEFLTKEQVAERAETARQNSVENLNVNTAGAQGLAAIAGIAGLALAMLRK